MLKKIAKITDRTAFKFFVNHSDKLTVHNNLPTTKKIVKVKRIKRKTLFISAVYGVLGVVVLYVPQYLYPELFLQNKYKVPFFDFYFDVSVVELFYGFFLVALEIWLLMRCDIKTVGEIAAVYGYSSEKNYENFNKETTELVYIGLGKDQKKITEVGINPFQNISKTGVAFIRLIFMLKALLTNFLFRIILKRVLGRLAVRAVVDLAGIPIYAFWNAYASSIVIRKTNIRMLAHDEMLNTGERFHDKFADNQEFINLIYDTLGYIAITKKHFYPSDFIFSRYFLNLFNIEIKEEHFVEKNYIEKVKKSKKEVQLAIGQLLVIGFLLDGKIGSLEVPVLKKLKQENIIPYEIKEIKIWTKQYMRGEGFDLMFEK